ncbi:hypothetical protein Q9R32_06905 [Actinotalea sp. AC32]|nr:hypothetical protein [Actinotalea sp. AC32]
MATRRRRSRLGPVAGVAAFTVLVAGGAAAVVGLLDRLDVEPPRPVRCSALADGTSWHLATDQAETAALLSATTVHRGMPARAATIAIATGLQESKLRNIDYGDRDSLGIFQQRPSQGWGTVEQVQDPVYATGAFLDALARVEGYESMEITVAAQTVQRSAYPDAYAQHEATSRAWASALTGWSAGAVTCSLPDPDGPGDATGLVERAGRDWAGSVTAAVGEDGAVVLDPTPLAALDGGAQRAGWAAAQWAVAVAEPFGVTRVAHADQVWDRTTGAWAAVDDVVADGRVVVTLAG